MIPVGNDGEHFINIYSSAKTELGRALSNFSRHEIVLYGIKFASLEAFWYWLGLADVMTPYEEAQLIQQVGKFAKTLGKQLRAKYGIEYSEHDVTDEFKKKIKFAMWQKCEQH